MSTLEATAWEQRVRHTNAGNTPWERAVAACQVHDGIDGVTIEEPSKFHSPLRHVKAGERYMESRC